MSEAGDARPLARRQVLGAGVAWTLLWVLPEACSSSGSGAPDAARDMGLPDASLDAPLCPSAPYARKVSIADAGIAKAGTSYEFTEECYSDPVCMDDRILLIHPVTKDVYIAMSGSCTHECENRSDGGCGPTYFPSMEFSVPEGGSPEAGEAGTHEAGISDATAGEGGAGLVLRDIVFCGCHGAVYSAIDGSVLRGPATQPLQILDTSESGGFVVVDIPAPAG